MLPERGRRWVCKCCPLSCGLWAVWCGMWRPLANPAESPCAILACGLVVLPVPACACPYALPACMFFLFAFSTCAGVRCTRTVIYFKAVCALLVFENTLTSAWPLFTISIVVFFTAWGSSTYSTWVPHASRPHKCQLPWQYSSIDLSTKSSGGRGGRFQ